MKKNTFHWQTMADSLLSLIITITRLQVLDSEQALKECDTCTV